MSYSRVSYIETNRTYFNTGIKVSNNMKYVVDCLIVELDSSDNGLMGIDVGATSTNSFGINVAASRTNWTFYCGGKYNDYSGAYTINSRYTVSLDKSTFSAYDIDAGTGSTKTVNGNPSTSNYNILIGTINRSSTLYQRGRFRFYEVYIYDGDTIIAHYLPYKDNETGYGVFYETVSNTFLSGNSPSSVIPGLPLFNIDPDNVTFSYSGGSSAITINSNNSWSASTNEEWITITPSSGTSAVTSTNVSVSYVPLSNRNGTVYFTDGDSSVELSVSQNKNNTAPFNNLFRNGNRIN